MDEFAQSRGDDDLFDDEIIPIEQPTESVQQPTPRTEQVSHDLALVAQPVVPSPPPPQINDSSRSHQSGRGGRGRGRGRERGGVREQVQHAGLADSKYASKTASSQVQAANARAANKAATDDTEKPSEQQIVVPEADLSPKQEAQIPTGPANPTPSRPLAVRGDRTNTGGVARPKLTEEQLAAKLAAAKERSQSLAAAHARAQADADNFAERERIATQKRAKETAERKVMEGERERNRERKLRGRGGREWDARKQETDFAGRGRGGGQTRSFGPNAEEEEQDMSIYQWHEDRGDGQRRGRGSRGTGRENRGRGRGRGDQRNGHGSQQPRQPDLIQDFPALPKSTPEQKEETQKPKFDRKISELVDIPAGTSWAEQVESSEAAKTS